ncbi:hypothetical protein OnM2_019093 [Erysiphe neolycopersici]|uniref:Uncharacterized protein n=1 Tax=Erysiphe neolycopersici TaxID=212602 RepID=A0A420I3M0_9PEZI|nr:hypothetical protein OnM2_019093 [Erysiphe neolycopersici]
MFDMSTCTNCSLNLPLLITKPTRCLTCPCDGQKNKDFNFISINLAIQNNKSTQFPIYHESIERCGLHSEYEDGNKKFCNQVSANRNSTDLSICPSFRISQQSSEFNFLSSYFKCSLNEDGENLRESLAQTASADYTNDSNRIDFDNDININIDEGFYDLHSENTEIDTTQAQLEALTKARELYISQIASRFIRARKIGTIVRWRRSTDFVREGKPMVRNKIRMRKTRSPRGAG